MSKINKTLALSLIGLVVGGASLIAHENAHSQMCFAYGAKDITTNYNIYGGETLCKDFPELSVEEKATLRKEHSELERASYLIEELQIITAAVGLYFIWTGDEKTFGN